MGSRNRPSGRSEADVVADLSGDLPAALGGQPDEAPVGIVEAGEDSIMTAPAGEAEDSIEAGAARMAHRGDLPRPDADPELEGERVAVVIFETGAVPIVDVAEARRLISAHEGRLATPRDTRIAGHGPRPRPQAPKAPAGEA